MIRNPATPCCLALVAAALIGCPPKDAAPPASKADAPAKAAAATDKAGAAEKAAPAKAPAAAESVVPAGVAHVTNDKWEDKETPTDKPAVDGTASAVANAKAAAAFTAAHGKACAAGADKVVNLDAAKSRVGYESYKNGNLPVKGKFDNVGGYAVLGADPALHFWADVLSLNSGDPVRDARLLKLFFEADKPENAMLSFQADSLTGLKDGAVPPGGGVIEAKGKFGMHGKSVPLTLKLKLSPGEGAGAWKATLAEETLLPFDPHALAEPLKALLVACNHKSMGSSVKLEFDLALTTGCK